MTTTPEYDRLKHDTKDGYDLNKLAAPSAPDSATPSPLTAEQCTVKGWFAALSDARYAAKAAGNEWLVEKISEIHVALATPPAQAPAIQAPEAVLSVKRSEWEALSPEAQDKLLKITGAASRNLSRAQAAADMLDKPLCTQPPEGWTCSRGAGHEGPCASSPTIQAPAAPFGYVTKDHRGGWHFFESRPYLDNAVECFSVFKEAPAIQAPEAVARYEAMGYALAMRVMQSDLYPTLDGRERAECDEFIRIGQAPAQAPAIQAPEAVAWRGILEAVRFDKSFGCLKSYNQEKVIAALATPSAAVSAGPVTPALINALPQPLRDYIHELETSADPAGTVRELVQLRDTNAGLQKMYRRATESMAEVIGCFDAAAGEGLAEALAETPDERLKDLVERRLMHAQYAAAHATPTSPVPAPATQADAAEVGQWTPIESAPKDGSEILLGRAANEELEQEAISVPGSWQAGYEDGVDYMGVDDGFVDSHYQVFSGGRSFGAESYRYAPNQPTHWMPLPPPPTSTEGRE